MVFKNLHAHTKKAIAGAGGALGGVPVTRTMHSRFGAYDTRGSIMTELFDHPDESILYSTATITNATSKLCQLWRPKFGVEIWKKMLNYDGIITKTYNSDLKKPLASIAMKQESLFKGRKMYKTAYTNSSL
ncbi:unnamed protein product [Sphenostylis stenocarpa]|uniref:Uncharacterized protein n=1 Tax=Sphenostylis stenocarpa TaxID=92480 RepID=A0AA86VRZ0_9FABA|nr:unnamed protein product [Sphenostylis stenocarpa]